MERLESVMARSFEKKTCPRCGQLLYADMTVCYGCLYDFTRKDNGPSEPAAAKTVAAKTVAAKPAAAKTAAVVSADAERGGVAPPEPGPSGREREDSALSGKPGPRPLSTPIGSPDDNEVTTLLDGPSVIEGPHAVCVRTDSADVLVPLGEKGLCVGRGSGNQVVLREKSVSRRHLRILPAEEGAEVRDLGSTNPAKYRGRPLRGTVLVPWGGEVELGGVVLSMCE